PARVPRPPRPPSPPVHMALGARARHRVREAQNAPSPGPLKPAGHHDHPSHSAPAAPRSLPAKHAAREPHSPPTAVPRTQPHSAQAPHHVLHDTRVARINHTTTAKSGLGAPW